MASIYRLWIIQKDSGLCLIDATISDFPQEKELNGVLIAGLLTSFMHFSQEIMGEYIKIFETESYRIVFSINEGTIFAVMMDRVGPPSIAKHVLSRIQARFTKQYQLEFEKSLNGDITEFNRITAEIEEVTQMKGVKLMKHVISKQSQQSYEEIKKSIQKFLK